MLAKAEAAAGVAQRWFLMTLAVAGALVVAGLGLAISLAGKMVRPVHALTATTAKIASGDLDAQAEILSHDEIGHRDWMPAFAGMTFYWHLTYEIDI